LTADTSRSALHDRTTSGAGGDLAALHAREADRLLAFLCSSDRGLGLADAEAVCQQAFSEVRASWPSHAPYSRPEVYVFAAAQRIVSGRPRPASGGDALTESAPDYWDRADVARLTVLQDSLDRLSPVPRRAVILREMCGFSPVEVAEIIGLPEPAVESARGDALRTLVPMIEAGTSNGQARRGPLSPEDFGALGRVLQHTDPRRIEERQRFAMSLAQAPAMTQAPSFGAGAGQQGMQQPGMQQPGMQPMQQPGMQQPGPAPAPPTAAVTPGLLAAAQQTAVQPAMTQAVLQQPMGQQPMGQPMAAPPTSVLGGASPSGDALFAATGAAPAPGGDPAASGNWMGGFAARRPGGPAADGSPPAISGAPVGRNPLTGSLPLGAPGFGGQPAVAPAPGPTSQPMYTAPQQPMAPAPTPQPPVPTYAAPASPPTYASPAFPGTPMYGDSPSYSGPTSLMPTNLRPGTTPLDAPGILGDAGLNVGTPIFDSVSAWFSAPAQSSPGDGRNGQSSNHWASLQDAGWREASARAAAGPQIAGNTGAGLPVRAPGANMVPSAAEAAMGMTRPFTREAPRADPGRVRNRLDSFQQGVQTARQQRDQSVDDDAAPPPWHVSPDVRPIEARRPAMPQPGYGAPNGAGAPNGFGEPNGFAGPHAPGAANGSGAANGFGGSNGFGPPSGPVFTGPPSGPLFTGPPSGPVFAGPPSGPVTMSAPEAPPAPPAPEPAPAPAGDGDARRGREGGFGVFYRDYLPQLLALLMIEGARPAVAAQIAQDAMSEAYREWARLDDPREWSRQVAMATWSAQRRSPGATDVGAPAGTPGSAASGDSPPVRPVNGLPTRSKGPGRG